MSVDKLKPDTERDAPVDFVSVLHEELSEIRKLREKRQWKNGDVATSSNFKSCEDAKPLIERRPEEVAAITRPTAADDILRAAHDERLVGLALSGGGIRSATFNLGLLQGFAKQRLLPMFDYLSTVSGGGFIGSWLEAWIYRAARNANTARCNTAVGASTSGVVSPIRSVQDCLNPDRFKKPQHEVPRPIRFLREYSNYITPQLGFLGGDTWAAIAIYLRNLFLNQLVLVLFLVSILLIPHMIVYLSQVTGHLICSYTAYTGPALAIFCVCISQAFVACNMRELCGTRSSKGVRYRFYARQGWILAIIAAPLFIAAWITTLWLWANFDPTWPWWYCALFGAFGFGVAWTLAALFDLPDSGPAAPHWNTRRAKIWSTAFSLVSGGAGGCFLYVLAAKIFAKQTQDSADLWHVVSFGTPLILLAFMIVGALQIGLMGLYFPDPRREWWGRLGGYLFIITILWTGAFALAIYSPLGLMWLRGWIKSLGIAWATTTIVGILGGRSGRSNGLERRTWKSAALSVTPYVFIIGFLAILAWLLELALALLNGVKSGVVSVFLSGSPVAQKVGGWIVAADYWLSTNSIRGTITPISSSDQSVAYAQAHWIILDSSLNLRLALFFTCTAVLCLVLSWRVNLNEFSMNLFYRNRLVRAYLGASHTDRHPNPFTGLDPADDLHLKELRSDQCYSGPFPIINATLNLVSGKDLAWQERKAASFIFTPLRSGFDTWLEQLDLTQGTPIPSSAKISPYAYRPTERFLYDYASSSRSDSGPRLGTAVSISGAAASPNMGYHTSPSLAFLMTFFDVRLGFWAGNPRHSTAWTKPGPQIGLFRLLSELFAQSDDEARSVYLSDGGHFENLGLYELVKRRCKFIVVSDADCDDGYAFGDLGNAIRKCREDIGVEIVDLDTQNIVPLANREDGNGRASTRHWAIGRIRYNLIDPSAEDGILVYLKSSMTGDEPADVLNYHRQHPAFPHESTSDQWFTESQFESYRRLGQHVVDQLFAGIPVENRSTADIFASLEAMWAKRRAQ